MKCSFFSFETRFFREYRVFSLQIFCKKFNFRKEIDLKYIEKVQKRYKKLENKLRHRRASGKKIKVGFIVSLAPMFPAKNLFKELLKNENYETSLIIVPDSRFGKEKYYETIEELKEYKDVCHVVPLDRESKFSLKSLADIVFLSLPYDILPREFSFLNIIKSNILPATVNYGLFRSTYDRECIIKSGLMSLFWKVFAENRHNLEEYKNYELIKGENVVLTGYSKMDSYENKEKKSAKKTILIAPHHSLGDGDKNTEGGGTKELSLAQFDKYSDLFLSLPERYLDVDFIFRPHPALFLRLQKEKSWGKERVEKYIETMKSKKNVLFSEGGDYFSEFSISDGIINDCGSYLAEYFYTKKPQCYLLKTPDDIKNKFTVFGQKCLENCYIAYNEESIIRFIEDVIISGDDPKKDVREKFSKEVVMYNYPNATKAIIECLDKI